MTIASLTLHHFTRVVDIGNFVCGPRSFDAARAANLAARGNQESQTAASLEAPATDEARERWASAPEIDEPQFWSLVADKQVEEAIIASWSGKQLLARLGNQSLVAVREESDVEDLRSRLIEESVKFRYPAGDSLTQDEALKKAEFGSEGAVAGGVLTAAAVGAADVGLEIGVPLAIGGELEGQSLYEGKPIDGVVAEDIGYLQKELGILEKSAENAEKAAEALAAAEVKEAGSWLTSSVQWCQDAVDGLFKFHAPGVGGIIEDGFLLLLTVTSLFSLFQLIGLKRKANTWSGLAHTATGAMQIGVVLYAMIEERCFRESPGALWAVFTFVIFMVNNITMWPLLKYFKGPEFQRVLFKLAYSFIISFQGIHAIAWSAAYPWLYWIVMPFWYYSILKLAESADNIFALLPDNDLIKEYQEGCRKRTKGLTDDTPTLVYSILNFAGAVFDNLYMAVYTWRGPAGFWGYSQATIPAVNDHLRTGLVKPCMGSLTISVVVFVGTLVYRKKCSIQTAIALNVVLASVGPWLILYYHKLIDWDEPWQPEIMGDWGSSPYFVNHFSDLPALLMAPFAFLGIKALSGAAVAPAIAADLPNGLVVDQSPGPSTSILPAELATASSADLLEPLSNSRAAQHAPELLSFNPAGLSSYPAGLSS